MIQFCKVHGIIDLSFGVGCFDVILDHSITKNVLFQGISSKNHMTLVKESIFQIIDYWLLFFLMSTSLNIAVHILVDRFYQNEQKAEEMASTVRVKSYRLCKK